MRFLLTIILAISLPVIAVGQGSELQQKAVNISLNEVFIHATLGIKAMTGDGQVVVDLDADKLLIPASNMKLISTGTALTRLGKDFRYSTDIAHDGIISDGILHGNLYIVGGGDPLTGSKDTVAIPVEQTFKEWEKIIRKAGIKSIDGFIVGDGRWLDDIPEEPTWLWNDIGTYYGTGMSGLNFYENMTSFNVSVKFSDGCASLDIQQAYPETPWMRIISNGTIGKKGTGDKLYMYTSELAPVAEIRGTYGIDRGRKRVDFSNKYPEYTCAVYFKNHLEKNGITCSKGATDFRLNSGSISDQVSPYGLSHEGDSLKVIGSTLSPSLDRIIFKTNHESNNLLAEALFRTLGKISTGDSSYESSRTSCMHVLEGLVGEIYQTVRIQDGSGLSRQNLISAEFMCSFLKAMMDTPHFGYYLSSLPFPGGKGSLSYNMSNYPETLRMRIRVKSGSMNNIRCYSGYILPEDYTFVPGIEIPQEVKDRTVIFSIMTNNCISPSWKVRPALDGFLAELAGF